MPRVKPLVVRPEEKVMAQINYYRTLTHNERIRSIAASTYTYRKAHPEMFRLSELIDIAKELGCTVSDLTAGI